MVSVRNIGRNLAKFEPAIFPRFEEKLLKKTDSEFKMPMVSIVGPPRVGSTVLYQLLIHSYQFNFINNMQNLFFSTPYMAYLLTKTIGPAKKINRSEFGYIKGGFSPSEGNNIWNKWFDFDVTERAPKQKKENLEYVAKVFNKIYLASSMPMITSWNAHAFYMKNVNMLIKKCVFVRLKRETKYIVLSILKAREELNGNVEKWWSLNPKETQHRKSNSVYEQVAMQVLAIEKRIDDCLSQNNIQCIEVDYSQLCENTKEILDRVKEKIIQEGIALKKRDSVLLPEMNASTPKIENKIDLEIERAINKAKKILNY